MAEALGTVLWTVGVVFVGFLLFTLWGGALRLAGVWADSIQDERVRAIVLDFVRNAEQRFREQGMGEIKHRDVVDAFLQHYPELAKRIDLDLLDRLIRATCLTMEEEGSAIVLVGEAGAGEGR